MAISAMSNKCYIEVKSLIQLEKHRKYNNVGSKMIFGHLLNKHLKAQNFNNDEKYRVCKSCYNNNKLKSGTMPELNDDMTLVVQVNAK